jgi:amino acid adenylation domain-containing protein
VALNEGETRPGGPGRSGRASFQQEQLWLVEQVAPGTPVSNDVRVWDLYGALDGAALQTVTDQLVARYEMLRTSLHHRDGHLWQQVNPPRPAVFVRLTADSAAVAAKMLEDFLVAPFDLAEASRLRAVLIRIRPEHHRFAMIIHHSACDGQSRVFLREELAGRYAALRAGRPAPPVTADADYVVFAAQERARWAASSAAAQGWLEHLSAAAADYGTLTTSQSRTLVAAARTLSFDLPKPELGRLLDRAAQVACTPNMALTAVFGATLSRWTGRPKVMFSCPVSSRIDPQYHRAVGLYVNSMPVMLDLSGSPAFDALLGQARDAVLSGLEYVHVPPDRIQAALADGAPGTDPLHQVTLNVERTGESQFAMADVTAVSLRVPPSQTIFGLSARIELGDRRAQLFLDYDPAVLTENEAARFGAHVSETVAVAAGARTAADLPPVPGADRRQLSAWCAGPRRKDAADLIECVAGQVHRRPGALAICDAQQSLSYQELWEESAAYAGRLHELGVGAEDVVGVCMSRTARLPLVVLAIMRAGGAFMPLDPRHPADRNVHLLTAMGARALISDLSLAAGAWGGPVLDAARPGEGPGRSGGRPDRPPVRVAGEALAYVILTSGSTGAPKGVMVTRRGLANYLRWATAAYALAPGSRVPLHTSPAFDLAITSLLGPLYAGATLQVLPDAAGPLAVADHLAAGYRMVKGTPSHLLALLDAADSAWSGQAPQVLVFGGENWPAEHARRWRARLPDARLVNEYGPTETVVGSTAYAVTGPLPGALVPVGRPVDNTRAYVVDAELRQVPAGVTGELVLGGAGVARGYRGAPALTAERFVPDPFDPVGGGRLYRTGDLARWNEEGELELAGRADDQIKILGYRVEPGEVEGCLARCPGVQHAAVIGERKADGNRLVAFLVPQATPAAALPEAARAWLSRWLPPHMVPGQFVLLDRMPTTSSGKLDRSALVPPRQPSPRPGPSGRSTRWHAVIHAIWCELLECDHVPADANFFQAGGNSLMLLRLHAVLREQGVSGLSLTELFRLPTINDLAARIDLTNRSGADSDAAGNGNL